MSDKVKINKDVLQKIIRSIKVDTHLKEIEDGDNPMSSTAYWISTLNKIDDVKLQKIVGTDVALYLVWLRYSAVFFWSITALNFFVILMYMTGDPKDQDNFRLNEF